MITLSLTVIAGSKGFAAKAGPPMIARVTAKALSTLRIVSPFAASQVPRAVQTRAGHARSPRSPIPASRTLKPIEVEGGTLFDEV